MERLHSTINTLTMQYFIYNGHNALTIYLPNLITVVFLLFIKSQLTTNAQNVLHTNQRMHRHV